MLVLIVHVFHCDSKTCWYSQLDCLFDCSCLFLLFMFFCILITTRFPTQGSFRIKFVMCTRARSRVSQCIHGIKQRGRERAAKASGQTVGSEKRHQKSEIRSHPAATAPSPRLASHPAKPVVRLVAAAHQPLRQPRRFEHPSARSRRKRAIHGSGK